MAEGVKEREILGFADVMVKKMGGLWQGGLIEADAGTKGGSGKNKEGRE